MQNPLPQSSVFLSASSQYLTAAKTKRKSTPPSTVKGVLQFGV